MIATRFLAAALVACAAGAQDFTAELWRDIRPIYAKTLDHPFLKGIADGTLPRERFQFYLVQDGLYLRAFSQGLSVLASKAPKEEWALKLAEHSIEAIQAERQMHEKILGSYGVTPQMAAAAEMAPTTRAYTNHFLASVERLSFVEGLASMLPCYWIYLEVGKELIKKGSKNKDYQRWIEQYGRAEYEKSVKQALAIMNEAARGATEEQRRSARRLFTLSARYEWMFWDMAWRQERWQP
jgi:thiaminase/transcriptional activator TenA